MSSLLKSNTAEMAVEYASAGFALVPIPSGSKGPTNKGWNRRETVITEQNLAAHISGNVGIAHAYCQPAPTAAIDIDDLERADAWLAGHSINLRALIKADDAVLILSRRPGRAKLLYRSEVGPLQTATVQEMLPDGRRTMVLEFRCASQDGLTVQDVLPPSIHPETGNPYIWAGKGDWNALPPLPSKLREIWQRELLIKGSRGDRLAPKITLSTVVVVDDTPRQRAILREQLKYISADCEYPLYRDIVWAILSLGWHDAPEIALSWCQTAPERFDPCDFNNVVSSHNLDRSPTIGTIFHYARLGGWNG
jgi:hypothetical protein